jgi:hypothetical protein
VKIGVKLVFPIGENEVAVENSIGIRSEEGDLTLAIESKIITKDQNPGIESLADKITKKDQNPVVEDLVVKNITKRMQEKINLAEISLVFELNMSGCNNKLKFLKIPPIFSFFSKLPVRTGTCLPGSGVSSPPPPYAVSILMNNIV